MTKYTAVDGTPELKKAIQGKFRRENGLDYEPSEITVGTGGKQVLYNAFMATVNPGDEVVVPAPYWVSYPDMVLLAGGTPVFATCPEQTGFKLQPDELEARDHAADQVGGPELAQQPDRGRLHRGRARALTDVLVRHPHVWVMTDDMYEHLVYDGFRFSTPAQIEPSLKSRTLTVNGVSKSFAMTGWRIGYAGGPKELIGAIAIIQSQSTTNPCSISQAASVVALNSPLDFLEERNATYKSRRDLVVDLLNEAPGLRCHRPEGAFYVYPNCAGVIGRHTPRAPTPHQRGFWPRAPRGGRRRRCPRQRLRARSLLPDLLRHRTEQLRRPAPASPGSASCSRTDSRVYRSPTSPDQGVAGPDGQLAGP